MSFAGIPIKQEARVMWSLICIHPVEIQHVLSVINSIIHSQLTALR